mmetsp:Transcript_1191/g.2107  ORF Transcript_1191/g.2107 Transcript_1191/m.2107 type:complete len:86 (+) Transcript_1191:1620-1877(+)
MRDAIEVSIAEDVVDFRGGESSQQERPGKNGEEPEEGSNTERSLLCSRLEKHSATFLYRSLLLWLWGCEGGRSGSSETFHLLRYL